MSSSTLPRAASSHSARVLACSAATNAGISTITLRLGRARSSSASKQLRRHVEHHRAALLGPHLADGLQQRVGIGRDPDAQRQHREARGDHASRAVDQGRKAEHHLAQHAAAIVAHRKRRRRPGGGHLGQCGQMPRRLQIGTRRGLLDVGVEPIERGQRGMLDRRGRRIGDVARGASARSERVSRNGRLVGSGGWQRARGRRPRMMGRAALRLKRSDRARATT